MNQFFCFLRFLCCFRVLWCSSPAFSFRKNYYCSWTKNLDLQISRWEIKDFVPKIEDIESKRMQNEQEVADVDIPICLICVEELKPVERDFASCVCSFRLCHCCWLRMYDGEKRLCPGCRRELKEDFQLVNNLQFPIKIMFSFQIHQEKEIGVNLMLLLDIISHFQSNVPIPSSLFRHCLALEEYEIPWLIKRMDMTGLVTKATVDERPSITIDAQTKALVERCVSSQNGITLAAEIIQYEFGRPVWQRDAKTVDLTIPHALSVWAYIVTSPDLLKQSLTLSITILYALDGNGNSHAAVDYATSSASHIRKCFGENSTEAYTAEYHRAFSMMKVYKFQDAYVLLSKLPSILGPDGEFQPAKLLSTLLKAGSGLVYCLCEMGRAMDSLVLANDLLGHIQSAVRCRLISDFEGCHIVTTLKYRKARTLIRLNRDDEALTELTATLLSNIQHYTERSPKTTVTKKQIALIHVKNNRFEEALRIYEEVCTVEKRILIDNHQQHLVTAAGIAAALCKMGDNDKAFKFCEDTLTSVDGIECPDNAIEILMVKRELAQALVGKKRFRVAKALLHEILERKLEILGHRHPFIQRAVDDLEALKLY